MHRRDRRHTGKKGRESQNDIKKLRRENEQLRREIWSLRDEYDKLEEILKSQKNREGSEEYEDRSEGDDKDDDEEAEDDSDYSGEEDDDDEDGDPDGEDVAGEDAAGDGERDQEERLENAENQKISSEKMNNSLHRLHVEFDDLSVVDEEEEVKRDKERKDANSTEDKDPAKTENDVNPIHMDPRNGYQCYPGQFGSSSGRIFYPDCPYPESGFPEMLAMSPSSVLLTPAIYDGQMAPVPSFESPGMTPMPPRYDDNLRDNHMTYGSPVGWQSEIFPPGGSFKMAETYQAGVMAAPGSAICTPSIFALSGKSDESPATTTTSPIDDRVSEKLTTSPIGGNATSTSIPSLLQRRNVLLKQASDFYGEPMVPMGGTIGGIEAPSSADAVTRNGWDFGTPGNNPGNRDMFCSSRDRKNDKDSSQEREGHLRAQPNGASDRPRHFFAPLAPKIAPARQDSGVTPDYSPASIPYFENFGTGRSSGSDRTTSTVISARHFRATPLGTGNFSDGGGGCKGSADICVNGAVPAYPDAFGSELRTYRSSENLLVGDREATTSRGNSSSRQGSNNPLVKSISCQDLTSEQLQNSLFEISRAFGGGGCGGDNKSLKLTKSDNTLDNTASGSPKPFRSQLNVTLRLPGRRDDSPDTPEIPKLPSIDYRLFSNRFLKTLESQSRGDYGNYRSPVARSPSIQANENEQGKQPQQPAVDYSSAVLTQSFARRLNPEDSATKSSVRGFVNDVEGDRRRPLLPSSTVQPIDPRIIGSPKSRQEFQVTSFEQPNPRSLLPGLTALDLDALRRIPQPNAVMASHQKLYQNVPFVPGGGPAMFCPPGQSAMRMFYDNQTLKVPAQTQTSIDGGSNHEDEEAEEAKATDDPATTPGSPTSLRRKRTVRKGRSNQTVDKIRPLSPAAQRRRLRKQSSVNSGDTGGESNKVGGLKPRKFSPATTTTTTTASDHLEDKNESRSSSSGQDSPRKDHNRRVSMYFNSKKRPSLVSVKTARSGSVENAKDGFRVDQLDTTNSERERTNSASSREAGGGGKARKSSVSSGKVPWCACWGNGCI